MTFYYYYNIYVCMCVCQSSLYYIIQSTHDGTNSIKQMHDALLNDHIMRGGELLASRDVINAVLQTIIALAAKSVFISLPNIYILYHMYKACSQAELFCWQLGRLLEARKSLHKSKNYNNNCLVSQQPLQGVGTYHAMILTLSPASQQCAPEREKEVDDLIERCVLLLHLWDCWS